MSQCSEGAFFDRLQATENTNRRRKEMANPWLKKNPFMSMWLSAANGVAGTVRGQATAQAKRNLKAAMAEPKAPAPKAKPKRKR
jgi:hypothetical protein